MYAFKLVSLCIQVSEYYAFVYDLFPSAVNLKHIKRLDIKSLL